MNQPKVAPVERFYGLSREFDTLVHRIIAGLERDKLSELKKDFHTRLRISQASPERSEIVEDMWDLFYDWCIFEQKLPDFIPRLEGEERSLWETLKTTNHRGMYRVQKISADSVRLKELYSGKAIVVPATAGGEFFGISKGDLVECRLSPPAASDGKGRSALLRRPSYHPVAVHDYIKKKVRQFRKSQDFSTYQTWLWLVVGMSLKCRIYTHMPIEKIYDDNSRI